MNARERLHATLSFQNCQGEGAVLETFHPWDLTVQRWLGEGLPEECNAHDTINSANEDDFKDITQYFNDGIAGPCARYEAFFGFDPMRRLFLQHPFNVFEEEILEETADYQLLRQRSGAVVKHTSSGLDLHVKPPVEEAADWEEIKRRSQKVMEEFYTDENIEAVYGKYREGHQRGDYSIRFAVTGFFWTPRDLFGIEGHMLAFYDFPELMHDMNRFLLDIYLKYLDKILDIVPADVFYIMEDLSGANGPMLSGDLFDEFVGAYYKKLIPFLKKKGVRHVFVDTDGDFEKLIPNFIEAGVEGFLPMDVNAGMDIVKVRQKFPDLKFIGAFNKLEIAKGKDAIDREFERLMPVIRQGGYVPGSDHQVAPSTSLADYQYYVSRLKEVMKEAGSSR